MSYTERNVLTDISFLCRDQIVLWYSKYQAARHSPVLAAALQDSEVKELSIPDYDSIHLTYAFQLMDTGYLAPVSLSTPLTTEVGHVLYRLGHQWDYSRLEVLAAETIITKPSWEVLHDLKRFHHQEYLSAVKTYLNLGESPPVVVADILAEFRLLKQAYNQLEIKHQEVDMERVLLKIQLDAQESGSERRTISNAEWSRI